mmetsp:Transcript_94495/g.273167  ORF Transcript_94495/g.273167 Transcript_94495/m.273167 type:complete len:202 (-) Transcript_94495:1837-2442(-)
MSGCMGACRVWRCARREALKAPGTFGCPTLRATLVCQPCCGGSMRSVLGQPLLGSTMAPVLPCRRRSWRRCGDCPRSRPRREALCTQQKAHCLPVCFAIWLPRRWRASRARLNFPFLHKFSTIRPSEVRRHSRSCSTQRLLRLSLRTANAVCCAAIAGASILDSSGALGTSVNKYAAGSASLHSTRPAHASSSCWTLPLSY